MSEEQKRLEEIETENKIWILYLVIIGVSFYANELEKKYFLCHDLNAKEKYRILIILIFSVVLFVYYYFFQDGYQAISQLRPYDSEEKKFFTKANFVASSLIFIAGIIFLMIAIFDKDLTTEIAFT